MRKDSLLCVLTLNIKIVKNNLDDIHFLGPIGINYVKIIEFFISIKMTK